MNNAAISLGSNLGDRMEMLNKAVAAVSMLPGTKITGISKVYETEPVSEVEQDLFLNAVIALETNLSPTALLGACLGIEASFGRWRIVKDGPRCIDLDLLFYESIKMETFELTLPHPRFLERAFVMVPLLDLYPSGRAGGVYFESKLKEIGTDGVELYNEGIKFK